MAMVPMAQTSGTNQLAESLTLSRIIAEWVNHVLVPLVQPHFIKHQHSCLGDLCICFSPFWPKNSQFFRSMSHHISSVQNRIPFHPSWSRMGFPVHGL